MEEKLYSVTVHLDPKYRQKLHYEQAKRVTDKKSKLSIAQLSAELLTKALDELPQ